MDRNKRVSRLFDLKMTEFETTDMFEVDSENCKPISARKLSLSLKKPCGNSSGGFAAKRPRTALQPLNERFSESDYIDMAVLYHLSLLTLRRIMIGRIIIFWLGRTHATKINLTNPVLKTYTNNHLMRLLYSIGWRAVKTFTNKHLMWLLYPIGWRATPVKLTRELGISIQLLPFFVLLAVYCVECELYRMIARTF